jgi:hypothetical protein
LCETPQRSYPEAVEAYALAGYDGHFLKGNHLSAASKRQWARNVDATASAGANGFVYNLLGIPLAGVIAAAAMSLSSVLVINNALRLRYICL